MKYIRFQLRRYNIHKMKTIISFFIVIPVFSILIGGFLARFIIVPIGQKSNVKTADENNISTTVKNTKKEYSFFTLQAGAFMNINNANILVDAIDKTKEGAYVIEEEGLYRVIIDVEADKNKLVDKKDKLESLGYSCLINEIYFNMQAIGEDDIKNYIGLNLEIINKQIERLKNGNNTNTDKIIEMIDSLEKSYTDIKVKNKITDINNKIKDTYAAYKNNLKSGNDVKYIYEEIILIKALFNSLEKVSNEDYAIINRDLAVAEKIIWG